MAGFFLTTVALRTSLIWPDSALGRRIARTPAGECWVSPLSHAILRDEFFTATKDSVAVARIGYAAVVANTRQMMRRPANYPYPDGDALEIWGQIRSADITIPAYKDGAAFHPEHVVGPDETLVYACAAANMKKLIGPAPVDQAVLSMLLRFGIEFLPSSEWLQ